MSKIELTVSPVKGISRPAQAGSCLELAVSRVLDGKHAIIPLRLILVKRIPIPIAIWLPIVGTQGEVSHE